MDILFFKINSQSCPHGQFEKGLSKYGGGSLVM